MLLDSIMGGVGPGDGDEIQLVEEGHQVYFLAAVSLVALFVSLAAVSLAAPSLAATPLSPWC